MVSTADELRLDGGRAMYALDLKDVTPLTVFPLKSPGISYLEIAVWESVDAFLTA